MDYCGTLLLYVEEDTERKYVRELLDEVGYLTRAFGAGHSIDDMLQTPADLVLIDLQLPGYYGFTVADGLRLGRIRAPIIFLVTAADPELRAEAYTYANVRGILPKPVSPRELVARVNGILQLQHV